ncbi:signal recognition particle-docking protein FtsY [Ectothiorhodospiraceae bacterium 2226]|nr:signal recognition particle-docking protein FtsY [Ectothiorhodospiraceae bacterium 2226]
MFGFWKNPKDVPTPPEEQAPKEPAAEPAKKPAFFQRLKERLSRTRNELTEGLATLMLGKKEIDQEILDEIETRLLMADVGIEATQTIIDDLTARVSRKQLGDVAALRDALREDMLALLAPSNHPLTIPAGPRPYVILMVGINGAGKTTTIGKLAKRFQADGHNVMLAAGDTFRAAAVEQIKVWGERNNIPVIAQERSSDAASVIYDGMQAAKARGADILIADTAGRLHTQANLMEELKKVRRVMGKLDPDAPHEVMLVLDATTGQNALNQAMQFQQAVGVTGVTLTKLDGTAKGGILFAIARRTALPIRFIGVGEGIDDLRPFDAEEFVDALMPPENGAQQGAN